MEPDPPVLDLHGRNSRRPVTCEPTWWSLRTLPKMRPGWEACGHAGSSRAHTATCGCTRLHGSVWVSGEKWVGAVAMYGMRVCEASPREPHLRRSVSTSGG